MQFIESNLDLIVDKAIDGGGSLHWLFDAKPKYKNNSSLVNGAVILIYGVENNTVYELNRYKLLIGLMQALHYIEGDISTIDSNVADLIIQLSIFNELRYD